MNDVAPSLFLASAEKAHREHIHQHNLFHKIKRQTETDIQQIVTEVVQTVSYIQQIDVDSNGSTFAIQTILAGSTGGATTEASSVVTTTQAASPGTTSTASSVTSTIIGSSQTGSSSSQSLLSNQSTTSTSSSASSIPTTSFPVLSVSSNSSTLISSSSSLTPNFSNSTTTSSSSSSYFTYLSSSSSVYSDSSSYSDLSSYSTSYLSSGSNATPTSGGGVAGGGTGTTGSASTSTAAAGDGTNSDSSSTPPASAIAGGVVGGLAGVALIIFFLMFILRWKKRHQNMLSLGSGDPGAGGMTHRGIGPAPSEPAGGMSQVRSSLFAVPNALASLTGFKRSSRHTDMTMSTDAGGERGFYRVSGRKLPSVLQTGGDGYGDNIAGNTLSGSSFYRDSQGFYGGPGSPTSTVYAGTQRPESGIPVMRPSPARTPVTEHGPFSIGPAPLTPPHRPDILGRSHPSQDGSHTSRFMEEV